MPIIGVEYCILGFLMAVNIYIYVELSFSSIQCQKLIGVYEKLCTSPGQSLVNYNGTLLQSQDQQMKDLGHESVLLSIQHRTAKENAIKRHRNSFSRV